MFTITIGGMERSFENADESWINQQVNRRRADGQDVYVRVRFNSPVSLVLSTPNAPNRGGGGGGGFTSQQQDIVDLWRNCGLSNIEFTGGHVVRFVKQVRQLL